MDYEIIRSRRRTLSLQVLPNGQVLVKAPLLMGKRQIDAFVKSKDPWLKRQFDRLAERIDLPSFSAEELAELKRQAKVFIPQRAACFAQKMGVRFGRVAIRRQRTRWGSCSGKGNLNFNCLLMLVPEDVRDYVIVHELCHLREMNHSPRFWTAVESVLPDYKLRRKWLKEHGSAIISRLAAE